MLDQARLASGQLPEPGPITASIDAAAAFARAAGATLAVQQLRDKDNAHALAMATTDTTRRR
jgi:hypothetical protein